MSHVPADLDDPSDLRDVKRQYKRLKYEATRAKSELEHARLGQESRIHEYERLQAEQTARLERLERDRRFLFEKEREASERCARYETELGDLRANYEAKLRTIQQQAHERVQLHLQRQMHEESSGGSDSNDDHKYNDDDEDDDEGESYTSEGTGASRRPPKERRTPHSLRLAQERARGHEATIQRLQDHLDTQARQTEQLRSTLETTMADLAQTRRELADTQTRLKHQIRREELLAKERDGDISTASTLTGGSNTEPRPPQWSEQKRQLEAQIRSLQKAVEVQRFHHENFELAQETQRDLEHRLQLLTPLRDQVAQLRLENTQLQRERTDWTATFRQLLRHENIPLLPLTPGDENSGVELKPFPPAVSDENNPHPTTATSADSLRLAAVATVARFIAQQRQTIANLHDELGQVRAQVGGSRVEQADLAEQLATTQARCTHLEQQHSRDKRTLQRLEKLRVLAHRDVENLREQIKSFHLEAEMMAAATNNQPSETEEPTAEQSSGQLQQQQQLQQVHRIEGLEQLVQEYREQVNQLNEQLAARPEVKPNANLTNETANPNPAAAAELDARAQARAAESESEMAVLRSQLARLEKQLAAQNSEMALLEHKIGQGDYNPRTTRILQLIDNPTSKAYEIREAALQALRKENAQLLERLTMKGGKATTDDQSSVAAGADHSQGSDSGGALVPQQTVDNLISSHADMQKQVAEKDKRMVRLKEVWRAKAQEIREAVYSLLGYRVDFLENGRVRLASMYNEADDHSFIFTSNAHDSGTLELSGGGNAAFVRSLDALIQYWVVERRSIPAFLATVTLELFDKTTAMMPPGHHAGWRGRDEMSRSMTSSMSLASCSTNPGPSANLV
ncbi:coiled-coil domain-containing protein mad1 [Dimargaris cristalligena]|nr:coiled-coil domain-containing protein mad1 [Dimargaris cristalligena]